MTSQGYCLCFEVVSPLNSVMFETLDLKYQAKQLSNILTGNTVSALSQNLTASEIKSKQLKHVKRSSIFRERRNQCSPCFEIPELFGANLSILLELIANSSPSSFELWPDHSNDISEWLQWTAAAAAANPLLQFPTLTHQLCRVLSTTPQRSTLGLLAGQDNARREEACMNASCSAWFCVMPAKT